MQIQEHIMLNNNNHPKNQQSEGKHKKDKNLHFRVEIFSQVSKGLGPWGTANVWMRN